MFGWEKPSLHCKRGGRKKLGPSRAVVSVGFVLDCWLEAMWQFYPRYCFVCLLVCLFVGTCKWRDCEWLVYVFGM